MSFISDDLQVFLELPPLRDKLRVQKDVLDYLGRNISHLTNDDIPILLRVKGKLFHHEPFQAKLDHYIQIAAKETPAAKKADDIGGRILAVEPQGISELKEEIQQLKEEGSYDLFDDLLELDINQDEAKVLEAELIDLCLPFVKNDVQDPLGEKSRLDQVWEELSNPDFSFIPLEVTKEVIKDYLSKYPDLPIEITQETYPHLGKEILLEMVSYHLEKKIERCHGFAEKLQMIEQCMGHVYPDIIHQALEKHLGINPVEWERIQSLDASAVDLSTYCIKKKDFAKSLEYGDQVRWAIRVHETVLMTKHLIDRKSVDFKELKNFLANRRADIAKELGHSGKYGVDLREGPFGTSCCLNYQDLGVFFRDKIEADDKQSHTITAKPGDHEVNLETVDVFYKIEDVPPRYKNLPPLEGGKHGKCWVIITHSSYENIDSIMEKVEQLYDEVLAVDPSNFEKIDELLGKIFWWICRAKPWHRGDPSIAEMLIRGVYAHKGIQKPGWKEGTIPWAEVMKADTAEEFATQYPSLFSADASSSSS